MKLWNRFTRWVLAVSEPETYRCQRGEDGLTSGAAESCGGTDLAEDKDAQQTQAEYAQLLAAVLALDRKLVAYDQHTFAGEIGTGANQAVIRHAQKLAIGGCAEAAYVLGRLLDSGILSSAEADLASTPEWYREFGSMSTAPEWYRLCESNNYAPGIYWLGGCFLHGKGVVADPVEGKRLLVRAAALGSIRAKHDIGILMSGPDASEDELSEARQWLEQACGEGMGRSAHALGWIYGREGHYLDAAKWYEVAHNLGNDDGRGATSLGALYLKGNGVEKDEALGYEWTLKGADRGDPAGEKNLHFLHMNGIGVPFDRRRIEVDLDWVALSGPEAISRLVEKVRLVMEHPDFMDSRSYPLGPIDSEFLHRDNFLLDIFGKAKELGIFGVFLSENIDLWRNTFVWLSGVWRTTESKVRYEVTRVLEEIIRAADEDFAEKSGLLELIDTLTESARGLTEMHPLVYACCGYTSADWARDRIGSILVRKGNEGIVRAVLGMVCNRNPIELWSERYADAILLRLGSQTLERVLILELKEDAQERFSRDQLISAFEVFTGGPKTTAGIEYLRVLKRGGGVWEAQSAALMNP